MSATTRIECPARAGATVHVHDEDDRELESLRCMDGHQADCIVGVDGRVRFIADGEPLDMSGNPRERRVTAVLESTNHRAQLLQVFARLSIPRSFELRAVRRLVQQTRQQL